MENEKYLAGIRSNQKFYLDKETLMLIPQTEVILLVGSITYEPNEDFTEFVRTVKEQELRFVCDLKNI